MDLAKRIRDQLSAVQRAMSQARTGVESIRAMIADLQRERERVRSAPVPFDEAVAAIDEMLARWRITGQEWVSTEAIIGVASRGERPQLVDPHAITAPVLLRLMLLLVGDQARETLIRQIEAFYRTADVGLPRDERVTRLRELDRELGKLEQADEAAIAAAEEGGLHIDRRANASPAALLGVEP